MSADWIDLTTKDQKYRPSSLTLDIPYLSVLLMKNAHGYKGEWILICHPFYNKERLETEDVEEAKQKAIDLIYKALNQIFAEL